MSNADTEKTTRDPTMGDHTRDILQASVAGVVRRDGLREAVSLRARLERERDVLERLAHHPCPCPRDTPAPEVAAVDAIIDHLARVLDAVPDVPTTGYDQLDRAIRTVLPTLRFHNYTGKWAKGSPLVQALSILSEHVGEGPVGAGENVDPEVITAHSRPPAADVPPDPPAADLADDLALDYIRAYYALVTAARALLDAMTRFGPGDSGQLWDAAQALRALVGDETPGTGDGA